MKKYLTVSDFLSSLDTKHKSIVELLRKYILESTPTLEENIKWNAPNYVSNGTDRITFNVLNKSNTVRIILHKGAKEKEDKNGRPIMADDTGLIEWNSDIRGTLEFNTLEEVQNNHKALLHIFRTWLSL